MVAPVTLAATCSGALAPASLSLLPFWTSSESANEIGMAPCWGSLWLAMVSVPVRLLPGLGAGPSESFGSAPSLPTVSVAGAPLSNALSASPGPKMPFGGGPPAAALAATPLPGLARAATAATACARSGSSSAAALALGAAASVWVSASRVSCLSHATLSAHSAEAADRTRAFLNVELFMTETGFTSARASLEGWDGLLERRGRNRRRGGFVPKLGSCVGDTRV